MTTTTARKNTTTARKKKAPPEGYLWLDQAATYLGFSTCTLYKWRQDGIGPEGQVIGRRWIAYEIAELDRFLKPSATAHAA